MSLLSLTNISAFYGASQALFKVNLRVEPGRVVALMGRNGMGKSTTVKTVFRMLPIAGGEALFDGHDLRGLPSHKAAKLGMGLVPEGRRCFPNLTVEENLTAAARPGHWNLKQVAELFPQLEERRTQPASSLSGGEQQMLAIGRALMTNPRLLVLDEATEGLAPIVRQEIWAAIGTLKRETGMAIVVIDKSLNELKQVADEAVVLNRGETVWHGSIADVAGGAAEEYLGV